MLIGTTTLLQAMLSLYNNLGHDFGFARQYQAFIEIDIAWNME